MPTTTRKWGSWRKTSPDNPGYVIEVFRARGASSGYEFIVRDRQGRDLRERCKVEWNRTGTIYQTRKQAADAGRRSLYWESEVMYL